MSTPAFIGSAYAGAVPKKYELVNIAPVLAPGAGGMSVKFSIEGTHLVAEVCIDGKVYKGAADLSGLGRFSSRVADAALAHYKANTLTVRRSVVTSDRGGRFVDRRPKGLMGGWFSDVERGVEDAATLGAAEGVRAMLPKHHKHKHDDHMLRDHAYAVKSAGQALVGAIADKHAMEFCAGWWHSLTHSLEKDVSGALHDLQGLVKEFKGPLMAAATAGAAALGVPPQIAGPLSQAVVNVAAGGSVAAAAKSTLAAAANNPALAQYIGPVKKAVAQATVAVQAAKTVANAAAGSPAAVQQVAALASAATGGDPAAQAAMSLVNQMPGVQQQLASLQQQLQAAQQQLAQQGGGGQQQPQGGGGQQPQYAQGGGPPQQYGGGGAQISQPTYTDPNAGNYSDGSDGSGGDTSTSGAPGPRAKAVQLAQGSPARVVGVVQTIDGQWAATGFASSDEADDWFGQWLGIPHAYAYVAYFDKGASWPVPENEQLGRSPAAQALTQVSGGVFAPILFTPIEAGLAAILAAAGGYSYANRDTRSAGWPALALAAGGGFAAGRYGEQAYDWARSKWDQHELKKAV